MNSNSSFRTVLYIGVSFSLGFVLSPQVQRASRIQFEEIKGFTYEMGKTASLPFLKAKAVPTRSPLYGETKPLKSKAQKKPTQNSTTTAKAPNPKDTTPKITPTTTKKISKAPTHNEQKRPYASYGHTQNSRAFQPEAVHLQAKAVSSSQDSWSRWEANGSNLSRAGNTNSSAGNPNLNPTNDNTSISEAEWQRRLTQAQTLQPFYDFHLALIEGNLNSQSFYSILNWLQPLAVEGTLQHTGLVYILKKVQSPQAYQLVYQLISKSPAAEEKLQDIIKAYLAPRNVSHLGQALSLANDGDYHTYTLMLIKKQVALEVSTSQPNLLSNSLVSTGSRRTANPSSSSANLSRALQRFLAQTDVQEEPKAIAASILQDLQTDKATLANLVE